MEERGASATSALCDVLFTLDPDLLPGSSPFLALSIPRSHSPSSLAFDLANPKKVSPRHARCAAAALRRCRVARALHFRLVSWPSASTPPRCCSNATLAEIAQSFTPPTRSHHPLGRLSPTHPSSHPHIPPPTHNVHMTPITFLTVILVACFSLAGVHTIFTW